VVAPVAILCGPGFEDRLGLVSKVSGYKMVGVTHSSGRMCNSLGITAVIQQRGTGDCERDTTITIVYRAILIQDEDEIGIAAPCERRIFALNARCYCAKAPDDCQNGPFSANDLLRQALICLAQRKSEPVVRRLARIVERSTPYG
jgi:hypothetical protein